MHYLATTEKGRVKARWIDLLENTILSINRSPHRGIKGLTPEYASKPANAVEVMRIQNARFARTTERVPAYLKRGSRVRLRLKAGSFGQRASEPQATEEVFKVARVFPSNSNFL